MWGSHYIFATTDKNTTILGYFEHYWSLLVNYLQGSENKFWTQITRLLFFFYFPLNFSWINILSKNLLQKGYILYIKIIIFLCLLLFIPTIHLFPSPFPFLCPLFFSLFNKFPLFKCFFSWKTEKYIPLSSLTTSYQNYLHNIAT